LAVNVSILSLMNQPSIPGLTRSSAPMKDTRESKNSVGTILLLEQIASTKKNRLKLDAIITRRFKPRRLRGKNCGSNAKRRSKSATRKIRHSRLKRQPKKQQKQRPRPRMIKKKKITKLSRLQRVSLKEKDNMSIDRRPKLRRNQQLILNPQKSLRRRSSLRPMRRRTTRSTEMKNTMMKSMIRRRKLQRLKRSLKSKTLRIQRVTLRLDC